MASRDIAIACQGGGSHAAYTAGVLPVLLGEFDNLARAHAAASQAYRESGTESGMEAPVLVAGSGWRVQAVRITGLAPRRMPAGGVAALADASRSGERVEAAPAATQVRH